MFVSSVLCVGALCVLCARSGCMFNRAHLLLACVMCDVCVCICDCVCWLMYLCCAVYVACCVLLVVCCVLWVVCCVLCGVCDVLCVVLLSC
jgi:hypothetical protein